MHYSLIQLVLTNAKIYFRFFLKETTANFHLSPSITIINATKKLIVTFFLSISICRRAAHVLENQSKHLQTSRCWIDQRARKKKFYTRNRIFRILQTTSSQTVFGVESQWRTKSLKYNGIFLNIWILWTVYYFFHFRGILNGKSEQFSCQL